MLDVPAGLREYRVRVADRRDRDANLHGRELQQGHVDTVLGQDRDCARAIQPLRQ